jgi:hypothetical protein
VCILLTIVLAHFTSKYIEQPIRHKEVAGKTIYLFFAGTTIVSLVAGLLIASTASSTITVSGTNLKFDLAKVVQHPSVYNDGCHVNYGETESGDCTYGKRDSKTTIVLYGDSLEAQWFPALEELARDRGFALVSLTKSACPAVEAPRDNKGAFQNSDCNQWRKNSLERIKQLKPAAIITSSFQYYAPARGSSERETWWRDGQKPLLTALQGTTDHVIYISDTPRPSRDIPNCLASRDVSACNTTKETPVNVINGFEVIDPTPWLCSKVCSAIQDDYIVYRDGSHISVAAALALKPQLEAALIAKGLFS